MKRSPIKKRNTLKSKKGLKKLGKKAINWIAVRAELVEEFKSKGIEICEAQLEDCLVDKFLAFAHSKKRREIKNDYELREVILCCTICHEKLDFKMSKERMQKIVLEIIDNRNNG